MIQDQEYAKRVNELKQYPIFEGLSKDCLKSLIYYMKSSTYSMHQLIVDYGKPATKLVLIQKGQVLISVRNSGSKLEAERKETEIFKAFESGQLARKSAIGQRRSDLEAAILIPPASFGEEYLGLNQSSYYRAQVKSQSCETIEFDLVDFNKCLNICAADYAYFHSLSLAKADHFRKPSLYLPPKPLPKPEKDAHPASPMADLPPLELVGMRQKRSWLAANRLLK